MTDLQITTLRNEASAAGDCMMVQICELALNGAPWERLECERVIRATETR